MFSIDVPTFGSVVLCAVLVCAAYAMAVAIAAARGRPRLLVSARYATYATCALVALGVFLLAYAFQTHDFRIRYVARYSDRSMPWWYLVTSLWGGQDGSLLWWSFLLSLYTAACTRWMRGRYPELQPYVLATLMSIVGFFAVLMLFAANPFYTSVAAPPVDGEGLNPLLQNYWMIIHPPTLYMGFVGWSVPFAFVIAALVSGRLREEWIHASRRWTVAAWGFLAFGNLLGALWSYEELGWGGYWAWDPVENAAFLPLLTGTAYLHSVMIQERNGMMKVWNVFLLCLTFTLTIFGTFLTRSGLIASVHSFAKSDIGNYFLVYLGLLIVGWVGLLIYRRRFLRAEAKIHSMLSREFAFVMNNWIFLSMMVFVLIATTFPLLSELVRNETVTVGPSFYNKWMVPLGLVLLFLTGVGPLIAWRKATGKNLVRAFRYPGGAALLAMIVHGAFGASLGFPPVVSSDEIYDTRTGQVLAAIFNVAPLFSVGLCVFVLGTVVQEFWRGAAVRMKNVGEDVFTALINLTFKAKRRYGGYIVHVGIVFMFLGFTGAAYDVEKEAALRPGESMQVGGYEVRYDGPRMELDTNKRMVFAAMTIRKGGADLDHVYPAKFIYATHPEMPTTEVAIRTTMVSDLYVIMSSINPETKMGTFKAIHRPLVAWIWLGGLVLLLGTFIAISPSLKEVLGEARDRGVSTPRTQAIAGVLLALAAGGALLFFAAQASAQSDSTSTLHAGSVEIRDPHERKLFDRLLCMCGDCQRLPLATCACGWAEEKRDELRERLAAGTSISAIQAAYREEFGPRAIAIPSDQGLDRALWAVPVVGIALAVGGLMWMGRRWAQRGSVADATAASAAAAASTAEVAAPRTDADAKLDAKLDEELRKLEGI